MNLTKGEETKPTFPIGNNTTRTTLHTSHTSVSTLMGLGQQASASQPLTQLPFVVQAPSGFQAFCLGSWRRREEESNDCNMPLPPFLCPPHSHKLGLKGHGVDAVAVQNARDAPSRLRGARAGRQGSRMKPLSRIPSH